MRFTVHINQKKCLHHDITVAEGALMDLLNQLSSWATEKIIESETFYFLSRNKVINEIPFFFSKPDTVYRAFKKLESKRLILHKKIGRNDYVKLSILGKDWNAINPDFDAALKLGNKSEFNTNSEINPSKLGNKSELQKKGFVDNQEVTFQNSEIFPTYKYINTTIDNSQREILKIIKEKEAFSFDLIFTNYTFHERLKTRISSEDITADFETDVFPILIKWICDNWTGGGLNSTSGNIQTKCASYVITVLKNGGLKSTPMKTENEPKQTRKRIDYGQ